MNLVNGEILDSRGCENALEDLGDMIEKTLSKQPLDPQTVISACEKLVADLDGEKNLSEMEALGIERGLAIGYMEKARSMFSGEALRFRLKKELGGDYPNTGTAPGVLTVAEKIMPLGVLLHIAAGNADGLPAFSVLEGLLTGNINILKLPAAEGGISVRILKELIRHEPTLSEYIYVFDYSSKDITHMERLFAPADAVVVWGGDSAVSAVRRLAQPNTKIIEWGHKLSFAYVTCGGITDEGLSGIAENIARTGQLLCSSCQGIYLDTDDMDDIINLCRRFLPLLENACRGIKIGVGVSAQTTIELCCEELESISVNKKVFRGKGCSLVAYNESALRAAIGFGNAWVKPLKRENLLRVLRPHKNRLQTVGLLCTDAEREELTERLFRTGIVRVCPGERMSEAYPGMPHDGEYPLLRYTKKVCEEYNK